MRTLGKAKRVRIYVNQDDRTGGKPVDAAVLNLLRAENAHGATVLRGVEGFGATGQIHTARLTEVAHRLPLIIEWIDTRERVERLLPRVLALVRHGLATVDDTDVVLLDPSPVRDLDAALRASAVMTREVVSVTPETPVREVVQLSLRWTYRAVPVVEDGRPVGIVTSSDLVARGGLGVRLDLLRGLDQPSLHAILERLARQDRTAADVMTPDPVTARADEPLPAVAERMIRRR
ncbi:MAG: DUF190 domain-containing protein [Anaeromyxobacter sp.]